MMTFASVMPLLFSKKRRQALDAVANDRSNLRRENVRLRDELHRMRVYVDGQMKQHFAVYNGGLERQLKTMFDLRLPTPWGPIGIRGIDDEPTYEDFHFPTITYVREQRWVPIREAGRV